MCPNHAGYHAYFLIPFFQKISILEQAKVQNFLLKKTQVFVLLFSMYTGKTAVQTSKGKKKYFGWWSCYIDGNIGNLGARLIFKFSKCHNDDLQLFAFCNLRSWRNVEDWSLPSPTSRAVTIRSDPGTHPRAWRIFRTTPFLLFQPGMREYVTFPGGWFFPDPVQ